MTRLYIIADLDTTKSINEDILDCDTYRNLNIARNYCNVGNIGTHGRYKVYHLTDKFDINSKNSYILVRHTVTNVYLIYPKIFNNCYSTVKRHQEVLNNYSSSLYSPYEIYAIKITK